MDEVTISWVGRDSFAEITAPVSVKWLFEKIADLRETHPHDVTLDIRGSSFRALLPVQYVHIFPPAYMRNEADDARKRRWNSEHPRH